MTLSNLSDRGTLRGALQRNSGNYNDLINKPAINGHTLIGNQSGHALGLANEDDIIYVEANPLGPATADLHKILVDDTIYSIPDVVVYGTASGAIASFDDGGNNKQLKSLKVTINPVQDLHGYDSPWAGGAGKNKATLNEAEATRGVKYIVNNATLAEDNYVVSFDVVNVTYTNGSSALLDLYDINNVNFAYPTPGQIRRVSDNAAMSSLTQPISGRFYYKVTGHSIKQIRLQFRSDSFGVWTGSMKNIQLEQGTEATSYEPYSNICPISGWTGANVYRTGIDNNRVVVPVSWQTEAGTVYGGKLDVTSGVLTVTHANIASYNGESINEPWISSEDAYESGATPTMGAQVVYPLTTPLTIQLTPTQITSLLGNNNLWSNTGDILECVYQRDLNIAINKALSQ